MTICTGHKRLSRLYYQHRLPPDTYKWSLLRGGLLSRWTFEYMNDDVLLLNLPQCQPKIGFKGGLSFKTNILQIHLYLKYSHTVLMN